MAFMSNHRWFRCDHLLGLRVEGPDHLEFCQAQLSADINGWADRSWRPAAWCRPDGRVLVMILAARHEDHVQWVIPAGQAGLIDRLRLFAIGRDVRIGSPHPVTASLAAHEDDITLAHDPSRALSLRRCDCAPDADRSTAWKIADFSVPIAWLGPDTSGRYLPQWLSLETLGALSYDKGCYPGQEVIARLHFRGKIKYRLRGCRLESLPPASAWPIPLVDATDADQVPIKRGELIDAVAIEHGAIGLAVCSIDVAAERELQARAAHQAVPCRVTEVDRLCYYLTK